MLPRHTVSPSPTVFCSDIMRLSVLWRKGCERGVRGCANLSDEGGLLLLWLCLARRASHSWTRSTSAVICARSVAFSAFKRAFSSSSVMPLRYTYIASQSEQLPFLKGL